MVPTRNFSILAVPSYSAFVKTYWGITLEVASGLVLVSSKSLSHDCSETMPTSPSKPPAYFSIFFILLFCLGNYNLMDRFRPYDLVRGNPIDSKPCALLLV